MFNYMLDSLDEMYDFTQNNVYDIYLSKDERKRLTKVPEN